MGDEVRRTQMGNNNAYCQDNEVSWFDWTLLQKHPDIHRFVKRLIGLRLNLDVFVYDHGLCLAELLERAQIEWHGTKLDQPDWGDDSHSIAFTVRGRLETAHVIINGYWEPLTFKLPPPPKGGWRRLMDTSLDSPDDFCGLAEAPTVEALDYTAQPRSIVLLATEVRSRRRRRS
jgi:glycogen operon protein